MHTSETPTWSETQTAEDFAVDVFDSTWSRSLGLWLVAGYIGLFIIRPWEVLAPWLANIKFERNYAIAMILVVLLTGRRWMPRFQCWTVFAFTASVALSAAFAWQSSFAWQPLYRYATVAITYFLFVAVCKAPRDLFFLVIAYIATMWVYLAKAIWEFAVHGRYEHAQSVSRLIGIELTFGDPNAVAMSTVVSLPFWWFLFHRRTALTIRWSPMWVRAYTSLVFSYPLLASCAVFLTNSRAGMVFLAVFVVLQAFSYYQKASRSFLVLAMIAGLTWLILPDEQQGRLETLWNPNAGPSNAKVSAEGRWAGFQAGMVMVQRFPLFGVGVGNFLPYRVSSIDGVGLIAHNLPGEILGEMGVAGGVCFSLMIFAIWRNSRSVRCESDEIHPTLVTLSELGKANLICLALLLCFGLSLHNGLRFNWLWIAAFAFSARMFFDAIKDEHLSGITDEAF